MHAACVSRTSSAGTPSARSCIEKRGEGRDRRVLEEAVARPRLAERPTRRGGEPVDRGPRALVPAPAATQLRLEHALIEEECAPDVAGDRHALDEVATAVGAAVGERPRGHLLDVRAHAGRPGASREKGVHADEARRRGTGARVVLREARLRWAAQARGHGVPRRPHRAADDPTAPRAGAALGHPRDAGPAARAPPPQRARGSERHAAPDAGPGRERSAHRRHAPPRSPDALGS
jgi:hypothetical protein